MIKLIVRLYKKIFISEPKEPYIPQGRLGFVKYPRDSYEDPECLFIFEKLTEVNYRTKTNLLEVDIYSNCTKSKSKLIKELGFPTWVNKELVEWETDEQMNERLNGSTQHFQNPHLADNNVQYGLIHQFTSG